MRPLAVALIVLVIMLGLAWLLGPQTPAPALPRTLVGSDPGWLQRAERLATQRRVLSFVSLALAPLFLWVVVRLGWSATLRDWLQAHGLVNPWLLVAAFVLIFTLATELLNGPLNYASLVLRRAYGLSQETTGAWLVRQATQIGVTLVLTLIAIEGLYWLLRVAPDRWWLWASGGFVLMTLLLTYLQPYVITPLFFTQRPLEDQDLRREIIALGERTGVPLTEVFVIDASRQGNEGNAYFTGIGGATRVVLYDTLLRDYPHPELMTILAHELGHWREQHVWKGIALAAVFAPLGLWLVHLVMGGLLPAWGIRDRADIAGLPLLLLIVTLGGYITLPVQNWISRQWERDADRFAIAATGDPQAFGATFARLAQQNLSDPTPPPIIEGLFGTHPAIGRRVADAQSANP
jgi:STE24 endopeptidase